MATSYEPSDSLHADTIHEAIKPRLRGVSHQVFFFVALAAGLLLQLSARTPRAGWVGLVYALSLAGMYGLSAAYHRPAWNERTRALMRRLDHAGIFVLIAGTYTPVAALGLPGWQGNVLLWFAWCGAALGVLHAAFFVHAFRSFNAFLYVLFGCAALPWLPTLYASLGLTRTLLLVAGGVVYLVGAVVYARRRPDPWPRVFGYHEVFHGMVVVASGLHFVAILSLLRQAT